jgi:hypothetical protein
MTGPLAISLFLFLGTVAWPHRPSFSCNLQQLSPAIDLSRAPDSVLQTHLGERVTVTGRFSMRGKVGPFIIVAGRPINLEPKGPFSWSPSYSRLEGRQVRVTGTLRFFHSPQPPRDDLPEARVADHFYFEAESAKVQLQKKR